MGYRINLGAWNGIFAVPCDVVDRQLKLAGAAQLKALLYILRHSSRTVELRELAQVCGISEGDARDAVDYWSSEGLLTCVDGLLSAPPVSVTAPQQTSEPEFVSASTELATVPAPPPVQAAEPLCDDVPEAPENPKPKAKERIRYAYNECAEMLAGDSELRQMLNVLEGLLCKNLNHTEISVFITLVRWYGLPASCVALLVEYCREIGRPSIAYIETVGIGWVSDEITTVEQVIDKISLLRTQRSAWSHLRALLDIPERSATKKEQEYCSAWITDWKMPDELILLAYERCVDSKGKLSMSYMNGILSNWHKKSITTVEQAAESASAPRSSARKPDGGGQPNSSGGMYGATYDKSEIEAILDEDWLDGE